MKFESTKKNTIIWNGGKPIRFVDGVYETGDPGEIAALKRVGYVSSQGGKKPEAPRREVKPAPAALGHYDEPAVRLEGKAAVKLKGKEK